MMLRPSTAFDEVLDAGLQLLARWSVLNCAKLGSLAPHPWNDQNLGSRATPATGPQQLLLGWSVPAPVHHCGPCKRNAGGWCIATRESFMRARIPISTSI
jgi:hypothetical protein